ncbi:hypothetical protein [Ilumatobacter sp.]|uniref:hypothetical protein n=1 Tax=Ilumatobacter sp. TaxID=1967498 RepID=UPI0037526F40
MPLIVDYCGELSSIDADGQLTIGREGNIRIDENPFLHRVFLTIGQQNGVWLISNVGSQLSATVSDPGGQMEAFLAPGGVIPVVFERTRVAFTAGPTSYEVLVTNTEPAFRAAVGQPGGVGDTTIGPTKLTVDQMLLILSLAEPRLRGDGRAVTNLPSSSEAAQRLGWKQTKFNRKLDNVCQKLTRAGVRGLHGTTSDVATARRARLVEYAVATRLVHAEHLSMLDQGD